MENKRILDELYFCANQNTRCYVACQIEKEKDKLQLCMMLNQDCADICHLTGHLLGRNSESEDLFLKFCREICEKCADECEKHSHHEYLKKCAETCRKCAKMCYDLQEVH